MIVPKNRNQENVNSYAVNSKLTKNKEVVKNINYNCWECNVLDLDRLQKPQKSN